VVELFGSERKVVRSRPDAAREGEKGEYSFKGFRAAHNFFSVEWKDSISQKRKRGYSYAG
jgi:hypothetical protein